MSSINTRINIQSIAVTAYKHDELSASTKQRLEALGIDPSTVHSETEAQILIAQAEAARQQNNSGQQQGGNFSQRQAETQQNIFNTMDMISLSNKIILGL